MAGASSRKKLLLMGRSGSGKSSMRSIIFSNYSAFDTRRLGATIDVEHSHLRFLGNMTLNLWDCGGQDAFMDNYFTTQRDHIFRMVQVLIHVFDVESKEVIKDIETFTRGLRQLKEFSPKAKIFVLLHKIDLVQVDKREELFSIMMRKLEESAGQFGFAITGFATSIWDESLYKAWSQIVCSLIPNMSLFEKNLQNFASISEAQEVILFEKTTFLVISHVSNNVEDGDAQLIEANGRNGLIPTHANINNSLSNLDPKRFEKISNIIKTYKQSCSKMRAQFQTFVLHGSSCSIYIDVFTPNMYVMVVLPNNTNGDSADEENLVLTNIRVAKKLFERIESNR